MKALSLATLLLCLAALQAQAEPAGIVVVRHAEKADDGSADPDLSAAGRERARALADALAHADIDGLIASSYRRTQQTLSVLARQRGIEPSLVAVQSGGIEAHVQAVADEVSQIDSDGLVVIAGHSNTVPMIVEALSGRQVAPIDESQYDFLYLLLPSSSGMQVIVTRFGRRSPQEAD